MTAPLEPARCVVLVAKEPVAGLVKTRLHSEFSPDEAATLARAALVDTFAAMSSTRAGHRVVALDGAPGPWVPPGFDVVAQPPGGLAVRLAAAFRDVLARPDRSPALLVGMDTPQLGEHLAAADFDGADALLGLTDDGGFWAIGLRTADDRVFDGIPMSTARTGETQLRRLHDLGLRVRLLPRLRDVDEPADARAVALADPTTRFAGTWRHLVGLRSVS
ncbi:TIGR04282 family arsenosugar biosynthesis glycosyltransferase [Cellulomonas sp. URHB0016]